MLHAVADLGGAFEVDTVRYYPRQDGSNDGRISGYKLYVSADGKDWGIPTNTTNTNLDIFMLMDLKL